MSRVSFSSSSKTSVGSASMWSEESAIPRAKMCLDAENCVSEHLVFTEFAELQYLIDACCSHVACAVTAVRFGFDAIICKNDISQEEGFDASFREDVDRFARVARRALIDNPERSLNDWTKLFILGAPRALGDALHAVIGAVVFDEGGLDDALAIVRDHVEYCVDLRFFCKYPDRKQDFEDVHKGVERRPPPDNRHVM